MQSREPASARKLQRAIDAFDARSGRRENPPRRSRPERTIGDPPRLVSPDHPSLDFILRLRAHVLEIVERSRRAGFHGMKGTLIAYGGLDGVDPIGVGKRRVVFPLSSKEVVKIQYAGDENEREVALWSLAERHVAERLAPVIAAGDGWLVMRRAESFMRAGRSPDGATPEDLEWIDEDSNMENVGIIDGRLVLVDYGSADR